MPHVVLVGKPAVEDIFKALRPILMRNERGILRTMDSYLESKKNSILIESLSIQENKATSFLAMISGREDGIVVRLYPKSEVEKTDGVKRLLAELAKQLLRRSQTSSWEKPISGNTLHDAHANQVRLLWLLR